LARGVASERSVPLTLLAAGDERLLARVAALNPLGAVRIDGLPFVAGGERDEKEQREGGVAHRPRIAAPPRFVNSLAYMAFPYGDHSFAGGSSRRTPGSSGLPSA